MSGLPGTGIGIGKALSLLPEALSILENNPERVSPCISGIFAGNEPDSLRRVLTVQIIKPVTVKRIAIIKCIPVVQKVASESAFSQMRIQDAAGNAVRTTPYYLDQARSGHIPKKLLGGLLAMAAIGSLIASPDLAQKLGIGGLFGVPAMSLLMEDTDRNRCIVHNTGEELPATLVNQSFKMPAKTAAVSFGTTVGLAAPAAVALDYAYNKWKSRREGMPEPDNPLHNLGRTIVDHPGVSLLAGGVAGAVTHHGAKKALEALKNRWKK